MTNDINATLLGLVDEVLAPFVIAFTLTNKADVKVVGVRLLPD